MISDDTAVQTIEDAMRDWQRYTCIKFRPKVDSDKNYVSIFKTAESGLVSCTRMISIYRIQKTFISSR